MNTQYDSRTADKFVVRLPDGLRDDIQGAADYMDTSMNTVFVQAVRQYLDTQQRQKLLLDALSLAVTRKVPPSVEQLQRDLNATDERADTATSLIRRMVANFDTEIECHEDVQPNDLKHDQVLAEMRDFLAGRGPAAQPQGEPVAFTAVGVLRDDGDGGLVPEWILEGGTAELWAGAVLLVADEDQDLCAEDGHCELYRTPAEQPAPAAGVPKSECPSCLGDSMFRCDACIPDFSPGNGNKARRRAGSLGLTIPAAPTPYDGFHNGVD